MAQEAYWALLDWRSLTAIGGFASGVTALASPFVLAWWKGRGEQLQTAATTAETAAERVERVSREQYLALERDRDWHVRRGDALQKRVDELEAEADAAERRFRAEGRAMDDWAHWYRHGWAATAARYCALFELFQRFVDGRATLERVQVTLNDLATRLPEAPPGVPLLSDAPTNRPPPLSSAQNTKGTPS